MRTLVLVLVLVLVSVPALATPVIEAGREQEILALFLPHQLGKDVTPGWKLWEVDVSPLAIRVECRGPAERRATLRLTHPSAASGERTASFVIERDKASDVAGISALDALARAVASNDRGGFFKTGVVPQVSIAPSRARFIFVPLATAVLALAGMLLVRRVRVPRA